MKVDENRCRKDGICVAECPMALLKLRKDTGYPDMMPGREKACNRCGHCVAVCPHGALSHPGIPVEECPGIRSELIINEEQAVQFLRSRRSIRAYKEKPVEKAKIEKLIESARYAPSGGNLQKVEWLVLTDKNKIKEIAGLTIEFMRRMIEMKPQILESLPYFSSIIKAWDMGNDPITYSAPLLVVASAPEAAQTGMVDVCLALSYLDLLAPTLGLGTCWAGLIQYAIISSASLKEFVGVPIEHPHHYPMILGYPMAKYYRLPERKPPKITFC